MEHIYQYFDIVKIRLYIVWSIPIDQHFCLTGSNVIAVQLNYHVFMFFVSLIAIVCYGFLVEKTLIMDIKTMIYNVYVIIKEGEKKYMDNILKLYDIMQLSYWYILNAMYMYLKLYLCFFVSVHVHHGFARTLPSAPASVCLDFWP